MFKTLGIVVLLSSSISSVYAVQPKNCSPMGQPGKRSYTYDQGTVVYEGSVFRDLSDLSRMHGMGPIEIPLGHDIYLIKRLFVKGTSMVSVAKAINAEISGAEITIKDNHFAIKTTSSVSTDPHDDQISYVVKGGTFLENIERFSKQMGVAIDTSEIDPFDSAQLLKPQLIIGSSVYDIVAKMVANTNIRVSFLDE
ncbi:hypothetical protein V6259_12510 [Marinomonas sp. TI.3.20]|uniref:hypothetical protein n=1 Tax=Marinomonas sp. TI.3.20 TaxID=3121296 RepID=UPI00311DBB6A